MYRLPSILILVISALLASGCVYELDVQQGNKLEADDIEKIQVGMTRSQVRFVLGTPVVGDVFHKDRWDYLYYYDPGRSNEIERRWLIVWFEDDRVREVERNVKPDVDHNLPAQNFNQPSDAS